MAITAIVDQGKIVNNGQPDSAKETTKGGKNDATQDMFLQLLVAEMKYQDPLEPTSNTEWIGQYATFTQIEQTTSMQGSMKQMEASQLVGKQVIMKSTNNLTGETNYFSGMVDYMYVEEGKVYLSVNNELYSIDDLDTVVDPDYMDAVQCGKDIDAMLSKLPAVKSINYHQDGNLIMQIRQKYETMNDYQKSFVNKDSVKLLEEYEARLKEIEPETDTDNSTGEQESGSTEGTGNTEGTTNNEGANGDNNSNGDTGNQP